MIQDAFVYGDNFPKNANMKSTVNRAVILILIGRVHLDSLELYLKYTYEERHSYRLDAIGEVEVGENKVPYEGTFDQLYNNDFRKFIEYNIQDTALLDKLDKKLRFIDLSNELHTQILFCYRPQWGCCCYRTSNYQRSTSQRLQVPK